MALFRITYKWLINKLIRLKPWGPAETTENAYPELREYFNVFEKQFVELLPRLKTMPIQQEHRLIGWERNKKLFEKFMREDPSIGISGAKICLVVACDYRDYLEAVVPDAQAQLEVSRG